MLNTSALGSLIPGPASWDAVLVVGYCVLAALIVSWPILRFLYRPWNFRKELIFGALAGDASVYYYKQFRPGAAVETKYAAQKLQLPVNGYDFSQTDRDNYLKAFKGDFFRWYGRRYYIAPVSMLIVLTIITAAWAQRMLRTWASNGGPGTNLRALTAAALAGAFVWIISDEIDRLRTRDFTTSDVYYYVFRILLAVPFAWAIAAVSVNGQTLGLPGSIPLAFFLGCFPTTTLFKIARRLAAQTLNLGDRSDKGSLELETLQSVTKTNAERFQDEGITSIVALAYTDPIDLTIRTNFDFSYVVDCVSQSLSWMYFGASSPILCKFSLRGSQEISNVVAWSSDATDVSRQAAAQKTIADAATAITISDLSFQTTLIQIVEDPYSKFLANVWN